jgi:hypothetical protein
MQRMKTLHRTKGIAHDLIVTKEGSTITLWTAAGVRQSVLDLGAPHLPGLEYARNTLAVMAFNPSARSFLILGLGGGSIPRMLLAARPGASVDAVEIDPAIPELARRFMTSSSSTLMSEKSIPTSAPPGSSWPAHGIALRARDWWSSTGWGAIPASINGCWRTSTRSSGTSGNYAMHARGIPSSSRPFERRRGRNFWKAREGSSAKFPSRISSDGSSKGSSRCRDHK